MAVRFRQRRVLVILVVALLVGLTFRSTVAGQLAEPRRNTYWPGRREEGVSLPSGQTHDPGTVPFSRQAMGIQLPVRRTLFVLPVQLRERETRAAAEGVRKQPNLGEAEPIDLCGGLSSGEQLQPGDGEGGSPRAVERFPRLSERPLGRPPRPRRPESGCRSEQRLRAFGPWQRCLVVPGRSADVAGFTPDSKGVIVRRTYEHGAWQLQAVRALLPSGLDAQQDRMESCLRTANPGNVRLGERPLT